MSALPGDTTAEDWSGRRFTFWRVLDPHTGQEAGIARGPRTKDRTRHRFCEEHQSWELVRRRITPREARDYARRALSGHKKEEE